MKMVIMGLVVAMALVGLGAGELPTTAPDSEALSIVRIINLLPVGERPEKDGWTEVRTRIVNEQLAHAAVGTTGAFEFVFDGRDSRHGGRYWISANQGKFSVDWMPQQPSIWIEAEFTPEATDTIERAKAGVRFKCDGRVRSIRLAREEASIALVDCSVVAAINPASRPAAIAQPPATLGALLESIPADERPKIDEWTRVREEAVGKWYADNMPGRRMQFVYTITGRESLDGDGCINGKCDLSRGVVPGLRWVRGAEALITLDFTHEASARIAKMKAGRIVRGVGNIRDFEARNMADNTGHDMTVYVSLEECGIE